MIKLSLAAAAGLLLATGMLWLSWTLAPDPIDSQDYELALQEALAQQLNAAPTAQQALYIKSDLKTLIGGLQARFPKRQILPWSQRPQDAGCEENNEHVMAPCARNDYISVDSAVFPLWRTALVSISTANSGSQVLLIKFGGSWRIVSTRGFVI
jgi:hypothetical protein